VSLGQNDNYLILEFTKLKDENARLKAENERWEFIHRMDTLAIQKQKAEVESLKKPAVIGGYNISEYIRMANSETLDFDNGDIFADMTLPERIKYIVESHAHLKAEVEQLQNRCDFLEGRGKE